MQNCHHPLRSSHWLYLLILLSIPFVVWAKLKVLPTFDDWNTLSQHYEGGFRYVFCRHDSFWRPFDELFKYFYSYHYQWFPVFSHLCILIGHLFNTILVFLLCRKLKFSELSQAVATAFFYFSPAVLATLWACDSMNQVYSQFWGLAALLAYLSYQGRRQCLAWMLCCLMATLTKENGIAWFFIAPVIAFVFGHIDVQRLRKHLFWAAVAIVIYLAVRFTIPMVGDYDDEYFSLDAPKVIKQLAMLFGFSWLAVDFVYLLHEPSRNLLFVLLTAVLSVPFIVVLFKDVSKWKQKGFLTLAASALVVVLPNILTNLSVMNVYASLGMFALLVAYNIHHISNVKWLKITFAGYLLAAIFIDTHLWFTSWQTSLAGKQMAQQTICDSKHPARKVFTITVEDDVRKLSSFCVSPCDAFGWGMAVMYETGMQWPKELRDSTVSYDTSAADIEKIAHRALNDGYDAVWIVKKKHVEVLEK